MTTTRTQLAALSQATQVLHRTLLDSVRAGYEKVHGPISDPVAFLHLVLEDPLFAWLRPMSTLIAQLDELVDDTEIPLDETKLTELRTRLERWTSQRGAEDDFAANYRVSLQADPEVVMAHAVFRDRLAALPALPRAA